MSDYLLEPVILESAWKMQFPKMSGLGKSLSGLLKGIPPMILELGNKIKTTLMQWKTESELRSRISAIQPQSDFKTEVFNNKADQDLNLTRVKEQVAGDIKRFGIIELNGKTYANTSYVPQIANDVFQRLSSDTRDKISEEQLRGLLVGFKGDSTQLQTILYEAFQQLDLNEKQRVWDVVLETACKYAVEELSKELVKILFPDSENGNLTEAQEKTLRSVLFQCYQSFVPPLLNIYLSHFFESLGGMMIKRKDGQESQIRPAGFVQTTSSESPHLKIDNGTFIIKASRENGVSIRSSRSLSSQGVDERSEPVILADYTGVMKTRFAFRQNVLTPISATPELRLTGIRFNELEKRNARLVTAGS